MPEFEFAGDVIRADAKEDECHGFFVALFERREGGVRCLRQNASQFTYLIFALNAANALNTLPSLSPTHLSAALCLFHSLIRV